MTHHRILCLAAALIGAVGCGGPRSFDLAPPSTRDTIRHAPDWLVDVPQKENHFTAAATATSRDMQIAMDKARTVAQADVAQQLGARLDDVTRRFVEEMGTGMTSEMLSAFTATTKAITSERITGTHVEKREIVAEGGIYRAYVLVRMPIGAANERLMQQLGANDALYNRFRASQAYADLEEEIREYHESQQ